MPWGRARVLSAGWAEWGGCAAGRYCARRRPRPHGLALHPAPESRGRPLCHPSLLPADRAAPGGAGARRPLRLPGLDRGGGGEAAGGGSAAPARPGRRVPGPGAARAAPAAGPARMGECAGSGCGAQRSLAGGWWNGNACSLGRPAAHRECTAADACWCPLPWCSQGWLLAHPGAQTLLVRAPPMHAPHPTCAPPHHTLPTLPPLLPGGLPLLCRPGGAGGRLRAAARQRERALGAAGGCKG